MKTREESVLGVFELFKGGGQRRRGEPEPLIPKETRTYDQLMDEVMGWNVGHTDILKILRIEIGEERLASWSQALEVGIRKGFSSASGNVKEGPLFPVFLDLYQFVKGLRTKLLANPTMKNVKRMERSDSLSVCIVCGIRAIQKERGAKRLIDTLQWMLLERYLG